MACSFLKGLLLLGWGLVLVVCDVWVRDGLGEGFEWVGRGGWCMGHLNIRLVWRILRRYGEGHNMGCLG